MANVEYSYESLDPNRNEIRTLLLEPATQLSDELACSLKITMLEEDEQSDYETISYVWGDPAVQDIITVDGRKLSLPTSAASALRRVRLQGARRCLWIDSLCIDQKNKVERGHQVAMMAKIYQNAHRNLIHLGEHKEDAIAAFRSVEALWNDAKAELGGQPLEDVTGLSQYPGAMVFSTRDDWTSTADLKAIVWLYNLPWFSRLWVLQETVLARRNLCFCGGNCLDLDIVLDATAFLGYRYYALPLRVNNIQGYNAALRMWMIRRVESTRKGIPLDAYLFNSAFMRCTDVRDKVYGQLGLYLAFNESTNLEPELMPNYGKTSTVVLRDAIRYAIAESETLFFLTRQQFKHAMPGLPSWVSDWWVDLSGVGERSFGAHFRSDGAKRYWDWERVKRPLPSQEHLLQLQGLVAGFVNTVSIELTEAGGGLAVEEIQSINEVASHAMGGDLTLGMTLIGGTDHDNRLAKEDLALSWPAFADYVLQHKCFPDKNVATHTDVLVHAKFYRSYLDAAVGRKLFTTKDGKCGLGPSRMQSGDTVAILQGAHVPFVLRARDHEYTVIGTAYVYGLMFGEAIETHVAQGLPWDDFDLI